MRWLMPVWLHRPGGCRIALVDSGAPQVSSTTGTLLPPNTITVVRCTPGQRVSAISNDGVSVSLDYGAHRPMPIDPDWVESLLPYEAQAVLDKLAEHFKGRPRSL